MKGQKTGGRSKGTPNQVTRDLRESIAALVEKNMKKLEADFDKLDSEKRLIVLERYLKYCLPPLQSLSVDLRRELDQLTDTQLNELAQKVIENSKL